MSGGKFDYKDMELQSEIFGCGNKPTNVFEDIEISELVWDTLNLIHDFDWYACGDTPEDNYLKAKAVFKKKWLSDQEMRAKKIVDEAIAQLRDELYKTFLSTNKT